LPLKNIWDKTLLDNGSRDNEFKARWIDGTIDGKFLLIEVTITEE